METLEPYREREFLPDDFQVQSWAQIEPYVEDLLDQLGDIQDADELTQWLLRWDELEVVVDEEGTRRYIRMTCQTDDEDAEQAYMDYVENLKPKLKQARQSLRERFVEHPALEGFDHEEHEVFLRSTRNAVQLYREENVPVETEIDRLSQKYQKITGEITVEFDGEEQTLQQMKRYQEKPDRSLRRSAWTTASKAQLERREELEDLFAKLRDRRRTLADNCGFSSPREYYFRRYERFDYDPEDCLQFQEGVREHWLPLKKTLQRIRRGRLGVKRLRPWDTQVDPEGRDALKPFDTVEELIDDVEALLESVEPDFAGYLTTLREKDLLDLENRPGKAPGGYQALLKEIRLPFIFTNAVGMHDDLNTLLHESGHAAHSMSCRDQPLSHYLNAPLEFSEVASMTMELLGGEYVDRIYDAEEVQRVHFEKLESITNLFCWVATVDAFQHRLYGEDSTDRSPAATWDEVMDEFADEVDWEGHEEARRYRWHRQLHVFEYPFYYIEYGIAQLGALQLWERYRNDPGNALDDLKSGLRLGGSRPLPELFEAAGLKFTFDPDTLGSTAGFVRDEIEGMIELDS